VNGLIFAADMAAPAEQAVSASAAAASASNHIPTDPLADYWLPGQFSTGAPSIDWAFWVVMWISIVLFVPIVIITTYFVFKYRRRTPDQEPLPSPSHNQLLEIGWTVPTVPIVAVIFYVGVHGFIDARTMPRNAYEVGVVAQKWSWLFEYPDGTKSNELHVPVDQNVVLTMRSQDVIHSCFIPVLRVKQDVVPGRYAKLWFKATAPVKAHLFCTEYCGDDHSKMITRFEAHDRAGFERWLEDAKDWRKWKVKGADGTDRAMTKEEAGEIFYKQRGCAGCHSIDGSNKTGPSFKGLFGSQREYTSAQGPGSVQADENYIRESIINPLAKVRVGFQPAMPSFAGQFREDEIDTIIQYIKTLK
jgi:cytochrome c oxidase subunit 2